MNDDTPVICHICNTDYSNSPIEGGLMFGKAPICPNCVGQVEDAFGIEAADIIVYCPEGQIFCDFVREYWTEMIED
jgi:hypothetical protein